MINQQRSSPPTDEPLTSGKPVVSTPAGSPEPTGVPNTTPAGSGSPPGQPAAPGQTPPILTPSPSQLPHQPVESPRLKKGFPKTLLLVVGFMVILGGLVFAAIKFKSTGIRLFGKKGEIVWWGLWQDSIITPLIEEYQENNPKVKITYVAQSTQDYRERLVNALARGNGPDIFHFHNSWVPMFKNELDVLPSSVMSTDEFSRIFYPVIISDITTNEGIVGIPLEFDTITLYINEDIFAAAGKTPPGNWDELIDLVDLDKPGSLTLKDEEGAIIQSGVALGRTENVDHWPEIVALMIFQNGASPAKPDECYTSGDSEVCLAADAMRFYSVFFLKHKTWNEFLPPSTIAFSSGKVAMYFGPSWRASEINKLNPNLRFRTVPLPQLRKDDPAEPDVSYATYWVEGVWKKSANKDLAWDFLKFLSERESLEKIYENTERSRLFGRPYPRVDMSDLLLDHEVFSSVIALAPNAKSWYLADETFDGPVGINSQINALFEEAIQEGISGRGESKVLKTAADGIKRVLSQYGIKVR